MDILLITTTGITIGYGLLTIIITITILTTLTFHIIRYTLHIHLINLVMEDTSLTLEAV